MSLTIVQDFSNSDLAAWMRMYANRTRAAHIRTLIGNFVLPIFGVYLLYSTIVSIRAEYASGQEWLGDTVYIVMSLFIILSPLLIRWVKIRQLSRTLPSRKAVLTLDEQHVVSLVGQVESAFPWTAVQRVVADKRVIGIYVAQSRFLPICRRFLTAEQYAELAALLRRKLDSAVLPRSL